MDNTSNNLPPTDASHQPGWRRPAVLITSLSLLAIASMAATISVTRDGSNLPTSEALLPGSVAEGKQLTPSSGDTEQGKVVLPAPAASPAAPILAQEGSSNFINNPVTPVPGWEDDKDSDVGSEDGNNGSTDGPDTDNPDTDAPDNPGTETPGGPGTDGPEAPSDDNGPVGTVVDPVVDDAVEVVDNSTGGATTPVTEPVTEVVGTVTDTVDSVVAPVLPSGNNTGVVGGLVKDAGGALGNVADVPASGLGLTSN